MVTSIVKWDIGSMIQNPGYHSSDMSRLEVEIRCHGLLVFCDQ
jgi:hypothetical protein